jgi:hypothetical protein
MQDLREAVPQTGQELVIGQQKHGDQRNPELSEHGVFGSPEEGFDLKVLFDPLEKQLYLPALPVDIRDGFR